MTTANGHHIIRLEFTSAFEMLDFVQVVSDHLARSVGLDEDSLHWVSVAIRESVINAIKHGNKSDAAKHVFVEFARDDRGACLGEVRGPDRHRRREIEAVGGALPHRR